eukprot:2448377-Amphidinium_carterae.1
MRQATQLGKDKDKSMATKGIFLKNGRCARMGSVAADWLVQGGTKTAPYFENVSGTEKAENRKPWNEDLFNFVRFSYFVEIIVHVSRVRGDSATVWFFFSWTLTSDTAKTLALDWRH